jgi:hypothetical protein
MPMPMPKLTPTAPSLATEIINVFRGSTNPRPIEILSLADVFERIRTGTYRKAVENLRLILATNGKPAYDRAKKKLDGVTFAGTFAPGRAIKKFTQHSGLVHGDIDGLTDVQDAKRRLTADPYTLYCFISPSGSGLKLGTRVVPVKDDVSYKRCWQAVADHYAQQHVVTWDPTGKDISRLCYVSYDPEIYVNLDAPLFPIPEALKEKAIELTEPPIPTAESEDFADPPTRPSRQFSPARHARYAEKAIRAAVAIIDASVPGSRHAHRLKASELLGGYVAGGVLTYDEAWGALAQAVARNTDDFERSMKTIDDGLRHGHARPLTLAKLEAEGKAWIAQQTQTAGRRTRKAAKPAVARADDDEDPASDSWPMDAPQALSWLQKSPRCKAWELVMVRKIDRHDGEFELHFANGRVAQLGPSIDVYAPRKVQAALAGVEIFIRDIDRRDWYPYARAIMLAAGPGEDLGTDNASVVKRWLTAFVRPGNSDRAIDMHDAKQKAALLRNLGTRRAGTEADGWCWSTDPRLYIHFETFKRYVTTPGRGLGERATDKELTRGLHRLGFYARQEQARDADGVARLWLWNSPVGFLQDEDLDEV